MKIKLFAGHREAKQALVLSVAGVTAIMLIANLILMVGIETQSPTHRYWKEKGHQTSGGLVLTSNAILSRKVSDASQRPNLPTVGSSVHRH